MVKRLAQKHHGIACEENYHDSLLAGLRKDEFPCLTYTRDLQDWRDFIRRSPEEYEAWIDGCTRGCTMFELQILEIADRDHVVILLADPEVSVNRFFDRPDEVPRRAVTMGMISIMQAKKILLVANGPAKKEILTRAFEGPITPQIPASILQLHPDVVLVGDAAALSGLGEAAMPL